MMKPFGDVCCEFEKDVFGDRWREYFFEHARFSSRSLLGRTYLIIGRRGSGKSSLAESFQYQSTIPNARAIRVSNDNNYMRHMRQIAEHAGAPANLMPSLVNAWKYIIWQLIFNQYSDVDRVIQSAVFMPFNGGTMSQFVTSLFKGFVSKFIADTGDELIHLLEEWVINDELKEAKEACLRRSAKKPLIITIDSMEQYSRGDHLEMSIAAALIEASSEFNRLYSRKGIYVKIFLPDEIFPHLKIDYVSNSAKYVRDPLFLHWRPKDLIRLVCWRYFKYLKSNVMTTYDEDDIDWDDFKDVRKKMWNPYFGETIINGAGVEEQSLPYILRHCQLRPRQLIMICNRIAESAIEANTFPKFSSETIRSAIKQIESDLADEVFNSYKSIYPNIEDIFLNTLSGFPAKFRGSELDRVAPQGAKYWQIEPYSPARFLQIVAELGVVGRLRGNQDSSSRMHNADFEFAMRDRLVIKQNDFCVVHPMFYQKLNIDTSNRNVVFPFPDHPDFEEIYG